MKSLLAVLIILPGPTLANFIETKWVVKDFIGERWQSDYAPIHQDIIGKYQSFWKGYAEGIFYNCNAEGQSFTYNTYNLKEFLNNKEMDIFKKFKNELNLVGEEIYVHRITCAKANSTFYPFITQSDSNKGYYLFEGGVYILEYEK